MAAQDDQPTPPADTSAGAAPSGEQTAAAADAQAAGPDTGSAESLAGELPPPGGVPGAPWGSMPGQPKPVGAFGRFARNRLTQIAAALAVGAIIGGGTVAFIDYHANSSTSQNQVSPFGSGSTGNGSNGNGYGGNGYGGGFPGGGFGNGGSGGFGDGQSGSGQSGSGSSSGGSGTGSSEGSQGFGT
jgi:hypothetical protein